jgi:hypothetical protein
VSSSHTSESSSICYGFAVVLTTLCFLPIAALFKCILPKKVGREVAYLAGLEDDTDYEEATSGKTFELKHDFRDHMKRL